MQLRTDEDSPQLKRDDADGSLSLSPTSTLCEGEEDMDVDDIEDIWADIDDSTPAVETWVPTAFFHRLKKILSYIDAFSARYNVGNVPVDCAWGTGSHSSHLVRNGKVVKIWAVGHLKSMWVFATEDDPRPRVRFGLDLLRNIDAAGVKRLMEMSTILPRKSWLFSTDFCADKRDHDDHQVFHDIYDARTIFSAKNKMRKLQPTDLTVGDVVLVECEFVRSRVERAHTLQWSAWTTSFHLRALSVLLSKEAPAAGLPRAFDNGVEDFDAEL